MLYMITSTRDVTKCDTAFIQQPCVMLYMITSTRDVTKCDTAFIQQPWQYLTRTHFYIRLWNVMSANDWSTSSYCLLISNELSALSRLIPHSIAKLTHWSETRMWTFLHVQ